LKGKKGKYMKSKFLHAAIAAVMLSVTCLVNIASAGIITSDDFNYNANDAYFTGADLQWLRWDSHQNMTLDDAIAANASYRVATRSEVDTLMSAFFDPWYEGAADEDRSDVMTVEVGMFRDLVGSLDNITHGFIQDPIQRFGVTRFHKVIKNRTQRQAVPVSAILVRATSVPEPSTLAIFALGIMGLASRRFKKQA
jgi:hypothetical protein